MILARWRRPARQPHPDRPDSRRDRGGRPRARALRGVRRRPTTLDGRFEMVVLHAGLVLRRLGELGAAGAAAGAGTGRPRVRAASRTRCARCRWATSASRGGCKRWPRRFCGRSRVYQAALDAGDHAALAARWLATSIAAQVAPTRRGPMLGEARAAARRRVRGGPLRGLRRRALPLSRRPGGAAMSERAAVQPSSAGRRAAAPKG